MVRSRKGSRKGSKKGSKKAKSRSVRSKVGMRPIVMKVNYQKNNNNGGLRKYSSKLVNRSRGCTEGTYKVKRCCDMLGRSNSNKKNTYCKDFDKQACCGLTKPTQPRSSNNSNNNTNTSTNNNLQPQQPIVKEYPFHKSTVKIMPKSSKLSRKGGNTRPKMPSALMHNIVRRGRTNHSGSNNSKLYASVKKAHQKLCEECDKVTKQLGTMPNEFKEFCDCCNK